MSESYRATPPEQQWSTGNGSGRSGSPFGSGQPNGDDATGETGKALLIGLLGGLLSAAGYMIYCRLPDEQREKLHTQVRGQLQQRISELRQNFNI
jgi:hypothetical protein